MAGRCCKLLECLDLHGIAKELGAADSELRSHFFKPSKRVQLFQKTNLVLLTAPAVGALPAGQVPCAP